MIPLEWVLNGNAQIPDMLMYAQVLGHGWVVVPKGWLPEDFTDSWTCFQAAETYRNVLKEERGY